MHQVMRHLGVGTPGLLRVTIEPAMAMAGKRRRKYSTSASQFMTQ